MVNRAYSLFEIKSVDDEQRIVEGFTSTPTPDRVGDVLDPKGASFSLPLPLLWQHRHDQPIGQVIAAKVTKDGIWIKAQIAKDVLPFIEDAWALIKAKLVRGFSVGWKPLEAPTVKGDIFTFAKWSWLETSAVTVPANAEASIATVKSLDIGRPAATGTEAIDALRNTPRDRGTSGVVVKATRKDPPMKTIPEQIKDFEATRAAKSARMSEIMQKAADTGVTLDETQSQEYDGLEAEVSSVDAHLVRLRKHEEMNKSVAVPVAGANPAEASHARAGQSVIRVVKELPPGIRFARYAMCIAAAKGSRSDALEFAKEAYPDDHGIQLAIKAAVGAATTANGQGPLLQYTDFIGDFVEYLRPGTIVGKFGVNGVPPLRKIPFNTRVSTQTAGGSASWVGQGKPKPLTKATFGTITLDFHKLACISVLTVEEVRFASPSAQEKVRDDLRDAIGAKMDVDFVNPANAGVANVSPASITNGVAATAVSGTDADAVRVDFKNLMAAYIAANVVPGTPVFIMSAQIAINLSLMLNPLGQREFPDLSMTGGRLFGIPVIVSEHLTSLGSPATGMLILVNASDIYLADDGAVDISASGEASLEMLDSALQQDGTIGTGASMVSLWQSNLLGIKAERFITWKKRRASAAQYLSPVAYTPTT